MWKRWRRQQQHHWTLPEVPSLGQRRQQRRLLRAWQQQPGVQAGQGQRGPAGQAERALRRRLLLLPVQRHGWRWERRAQTLSLLCSKT